MDNLRAADMAALCMMLCTVLVAQAAGPPGSASLHAIEEELDEVVVVGEQPGPAMWKVSKGDHTLWIMGTLSPLPARITWRSKHVEEVIERSGEILGTTWLRVEAKAQTRADRRRYRAATAEKSDSTMQQTLPPDVYTRWVAAHRHWFGKDPDPKQRTSPVNAAWRLYRQALEKSGLSERPVVHASVADLSRKYRVGTRENSLVAYVDAGAVAAEIEDSKQGAREREISCLIDTLDRIEHDLPNVRKRAAAWAIGDIATLRALPPSVARGMTSSCVEASIDRSATRGDAMTELATRSERNRWADIADLLETYDTSFTIVGIDDLLRKQGILDRFRAEGYSVEEPQ